MEIRISEELCALVPNIKVGIIHYHGIKVGESPQMVKGRMQMFQESLFFDLEEKNVNELEGIKEWRQLFKVVGKDPNRYRHSAEALYRRVKKQNYLLPVNCSIDLNNFFSLQYEIPIGIYDLDKLNGDIIIRLGEENEEYNGLNGRPNSLHRLIISADEKGAFGSPFVDSERTCVGEETINALHIIYLQPSMEKEAAHEMVKSLMDMYLQVHGGDGEFKIIGC